MNKSVITVSLACVLFSVGSLAAKLETAEQGNQKAERMKDNASRAIEPTEEEFELIMEPNEQQVTNSNNKKDEKVKLDPPQNSQQDLTQPGIKKQAENKTNQQRNELGKGSEIGQAKREENSKKWWKFWEE